MERLVDYRYSELISAGFDLITPNIARRLQYTHFFTGTDPIHAGLITDHKSASGRSYRDTWCVSFQYHLKQFSVKDQQTTVTLTSLSTKGYPLLLLPMLIVHELGHVLHEIIGFDHDAEPVTKYAELDRYEAFAEAFTAWLNPGYGQYYKQLRRVDNKTISLFRELETLWR